MSSGQKPRWPAYFPRMKDRGRHRRRGVRTVLYDANFNPIWPPVLHVKGMTVPVRFDKGTLRVTGWMIGTRRLDRQTGMWIQEDA
ncbi:hypothetical protein ACIBQ0_17040 [Nocardia nova]|uniref:hypothetical protein n=1 Tax=Nocardia nova TaxID=37330 RepID=UPI00379B6EBE